MECNVVFCAYREALSSCVCVCVYWPFFGHIVIDNNDNKGTEMIRRRDICDMVIRNDIKTHMYIETPTNFPFAF